MSDPTQITDERAGYEAMAYRKPVGRFWYKIKTPGGGHIYVGIVNAESSSKCQAGRFLDFETCRDFLDGRPCVDAFGKARNQPEGESEE